MARQFYNNKVAAQRKINSMSVDRFLGVDYSSSMNNIKDYHAYDISNFIMKNNALETRNGYEEVGKNKVNGLWECNYKGKKIVIGHLGTHLYLIKGIDNYDNNSYNYIEIPTQSTIKDQKSFGVFANDRLYILCGSYVVVKFLQDYDEVVINSENIGEYFKGFSVYNDVDTYIPTTTIGITADNSLSNIKRVHLDDINMMSNKVKYKLSTNISETLNPVYNNYKDENKVSRFYYLDTKFKLKKFTIKILDALNEVKNITGEIKHDISKPLEEYLVVKRADLGNAIFDEGVPQDAEIRIGTRPITSTSLKLDYDFKNPSLSNDNIEIEVELTDSNDYKLIDDCTFGIVYGAEGNRNRLFVSGNKNKPNVDYHTSRRNIYASDTDIDLQDSQDFTYFSVFDYTAYGTSNSAVSDYQIMGNGELMVLKEETINEPTIYFRQGQFQSDESGYVREIFPMRVGNIGQGTIRSKNGTLRNLNNDILFTSSNGVFGISAGISAGNLQGDYQYAYGRSILINEKLKEWIHNATNIATIVFDNKYFITLKTKEINNETLLLEDKYITMVADGRYAVKYGENIDNEYNYEWFRFDGIKADDYFIIDNKLYFTNNGGLFRLDLYSNSYVDIEKLNLNVGDIKIINGEIIVNSQSEELNKFIEEKPILTINSDINGDTYIKLNCKVKDNHIKLDISNDKLQYDYLEDETNAIYIYYSELTEMIKVYVKPIEYSTGVYDLYNEPTFDTKIDLSNVNNIDLFTDVELKKFRFIKENDIYNLIDIYDNKVELCKPELTTFDIYGYLEVKIPVNSYYLTKSYNMGQSIINKVLKSVTITNDSDKLSVVNFGFATKKLIKKFESNIYSGTNGLVNTYNNIFNADLTLKTFTTSFTKYYLLKFNFIQFAFYNNAGQNCILNNLTAVYTLGFKQKGVS